MVIVKRVLFPLVLGLMLTGCAALARSSSTANPAGARMANINVLAASYEHAVGDQTRCNRNSSRITSGWVETICAPIAYLMIFTTPDGERAARAAYPLEKGYRLVEGSNWMIETVDASAQKAQRRLGGTLSLPK